MIRVGVTGGIGSGKSTCCRIFAERGAAVYDSDREAKRLMNGDGELRRRIAGRFGREVYAGGALNRSYLAGVIFGDAEARAALNALVHPAVAADFVRWCGRQRGPYVVFESALLFDAELDRLVDRTVAVMAPPALRIERTCRRDGVSPEEVQRRIAAQLSDDELLQRADYCVVNIHEEELAAEIGRLDTLFRHEATLS